ncbi:MULTISPECIES: YihY/virulence factor BrkB family protein [Kocuria]|uniref:YihY/virulence factor BrkB family protein n=1 Tax=Kocuria subflava TaxID=1736139 RepID=A0A846U6B3_9MICC|nr:MULTISPECIES: YihY/virulence factor BrkB family protein [unclassified Kocuria]NKE09176.1 YihY/virulence factor BrkB family protein [Kocuria subflava]
MSKNTLRETLERAEAPAPDNSSKPENPTQVSKRSWKYIFKRSLAEFTQDGCTDLAASLTYFTVLSVFPGLLAVVSLLGVFGQGQQTADAITEFLAGRVPEELNTLLEPTITNLTQATGAGIVALIIGVASGLWTASGYVGAFSRAMNRVYDVSEGRTFIKHKASMLAVTLFVVVTVVLIFLMVLLSGSIARTLGDAIGLGETSVMVWNIAKWPVVLLLLILLVAVLYYATPNVQQPKFKWVSPGAVFAIIGVIVAAVGFSIYATQFASQADTYGVIGGVILGLLGIWIFNNVLLFGAEIDAELQRGRELEAGLPSEEMLHLPPRDVKAVTKALEKHEKMVEEGRKVRLAHETVDYSQSGKDSGRDGQAEVANFNGETKQVLERERTETR